MKRLILIDTHAIIHRAFHALPPLTSPSGEVVNAVYGFASILLKIIKDLKPDYVVAAFDHEGPTFRHVAYERYKAQREKGPDELYSQIPKVRELLVAFGIFCVDKQGYEADDIIGTVAEIVRRKNPDAEIIIVTGDLDTLQLVDEKTKVFTMRKGVSDTVLYDEKLVRERYGLAPRQLIDYKGLRGDPSDNIPGVRGIGEKTASELLKDYGSIEEIYRTLKKGDLKARPAVIEALKAHEADALFSKTLVTIDRRMPLDFVLGAAKFRKSSANQEKVGEAFEKLGFRSLLLRMENNFPRQSGAGQEKAPAAGREINPVRNSRGVFNPPRELPQAVTHAAERRGIISNGIKVKMTRSLASIGPRDRALVLAGGDGEIFIVVKADEVHKLTFRASDLAKWADWLRKAGEVFVFDWKLMLKEGFPGQEARIRDLMIMWWLMEPGRKSYKAPDLAAREPGVTKETRGGTAAALFDLAPRLAKRLHEEDLLRVYDELEAPLIPILCRMEQTGIGFDPRPLVVLSKKLAGELSGLEKKIHRAAGGEFNINSPRQVAEVLFGKLNLAAKGIRRTKKSGELSTRETELLKLRRAHPVVGDILRFRELAKLKSTYVDALPELVGSDGRLHTTWNQTGTATGRLSSQNPNLQNIPVKGQFGGEIRKAFVADKGYRLVAFDYSQLELRIAADLAGDEKMIEAFRQGLDIHALTAAEISDLPMDKVTPELRRRAKTLNFGILYGMGARALAEAAEISRDEAEVFIERYFEDFTGIARFINDAKKFAHDHGWTKTTFGRKRFFPDIGSSNFRLQRELERQAVNHPIQGTAADIMKKTMIEVNRFLEEKKLRDQARMLLQVHDELVFEIRESVVEELIPEIRRIMEGAWAGKVTMAVEARAGKSWAEA